MKTMLLLLALIFCVQFSRAQVQKLSFQDMENALTLSLNEAEERLFLKGYSFAGNDTLPDGGLLHTFSTRGKTVKTAKALSKAIYENEVEKAYVQYVTYEAAEFVSLRKIMIEKQFTRTGVDNISENSTYVKDNLEVNFATDESDQNKAFIVTLRNKGGVIAKKPVKKLSLKGLLKDE
jgi:hypothetical protein